MWQINEVVLFDNDPYRILAIEDGQVVWMQISADKGVDLPLYFQTPVIT
ncbi:hypothetical protein A8526_005183 [Escherichia coli]|nr:hypothetical protein [Escherichia coli]